MKLTAARTMAANSAQRVAAHIRTANGIGLSLAAVGRSRALNARLEITMREET